MTELKPCPFCGGAAEIIHQPGYGDKPYSASCTGGCMAEIFPFGTPEEAAKKWNRYAEKYVTQAVPFRQKGVAAEAWNRRNGNV